MGFPCISHGQQMGFPLGFLSMAIEKTLVSQEYPWISNEFAMLFSIDVPWFSHGFSMDLLLRILGH